MGGQGKLNPLKKSFLPLILGLLDNFRIVQEEFHGFFLVILCCRWKNGNQTPPYCRKVIVLAERKKEGPRSREFGGSYTVLVSAWKLFWRPATFSKIRTCSTTTRYRNLQTQGAVSTPVIFPFSPGCPFNSVRKSLQNVEKHPCGSYLPTGFAQRRYI